jgi:hypothetical protein
MSVDRIESIIESAVSAYRDRNAAGRILPSSSWFDLAPEQRDSLFERQLESRWIEQALHPRGWSTTAQSVLDRIQIRGA